MNNKTITYKLPPPQVLIFTAETISIYKALNYVYTEHEIHSQTKYIIYSESLNNLMAITNMKNAFHIKKLIQEETFPANKKAKKFNLYGFQGLSKFQKTK